MWCSSSDNPGNHHLSEPHHRIVRIPPGEAVVLNSAERAPYLLVIEVLAGDLDFDPAQRANKEVLRKVVTKQVDTRGTWIDFGLSSSGLRQEITVNPDRTCRTPFTFGQSPFLGGPPTAASSTFSNEDEEMDLVEQLYGVDQPLRMLDVEDSIAIPPTPKNRELDMVAWSRSSPLLSQTSAGETQRRQGSVNLSGLSLQSSVSQRSPLTPENESPVMLSMDEYSERMRTAAIMLAQLNADHSRDSISVPYKSNGLSRVDNPSHHSG
jgi:phosphatidylinositol 4-kinase B